MNSALVDLLCQRVSSPRLTEPAPNKQELEKIFKSALRAPDHMRLKPWRYLVIEGESRHKLGQLYLSVSQSLAEANGETLDDIKAERLKTMALRAPMIIVAIASVTEHPKVPKEEQVLSCGVGVGYMLVALQALGYGGVWRTGDISLNGDVCKGLGLQEHECIVGFLYLGTPAGELKCAPELSVSDYVQTWT